MIEKPIDTRIGQILVRELGWSQDLVNAALEKQVVDPAEPLGRILKSLSPERPSSEIALGLLIQRRSTRS